MPDILHRVGINSSPDKVFAALSTIPGLQHWWVVATSGDARLGGVIDFGFCQMKVTEIEPAKTVHWECIGGPEEWLGTEVSFQLKWQDEQTFVSFKHSAWREPVEFMHHCSTKWATFLLSLRDWLERSEGRPAPYDVKIHVGD
jgi:uncharacterized protein YndB with AHSA1/START domain